MEQFERTFSSVGVALPTNIGQNGEGRELRIRLWVEGIEYEINGCDEPGESCTARLIVRTRTRKSIGPRSNGQDQNTEDEGEGESSRHPIGRSASKERSNPDEKRRSESRYLPEEMLMFGSTQNEDTYDFAYRLGRWILATKDVEESIKRVIEHALKDQIIDRTGR